MIFCPLTETVRERKSLRREYRAAKATGVIRPGETCFFFRRGIKIYYVGYSEIMKCFRRVMLISAGGDNGNMKLETLVIADKEKELAQVQVPGTDAAKLLLDELKVKMPHADFSCPNKTEEGDK